MPARVSVRRTRPFIGRERPVLQARASTRTEGEFRVRSRRGWEMTPLVPELRELPVAGIFDGELVAQGGARPRLRS
jgi:hypothetical protein